MNKAVIFDMDGVIVDSEYTFLESKTEILKEAGHHKDVSYQYQFMGTTAEFMWNVMKEELALPQEITHYIQLMNQKRADMIKRDGIKAIPGAVELIKRLHSDGYALAVASSSPKHEIEHNMDALGIRDYFDFFVSGEEVKHGKPSPDIFIYTAGLLRQPLSECYVVEDTPNGTRAGNASGIYTVGFANPAFPVQDLSAANVVVDSMEKVYQQITLS